MNGVPQYHHILSIEHTFVPTSYVHYDNLLFITVVQFVLMCTRIMVNADILLHDGALAFSLM